MYARSCPHGREQHHHRAIASVRRLCEWSAGHARACAPTCAVAVRACADGHHTRAHGAPTTTNPGSGWWRHNASRQRRRRWLHRHMTPRHILTRGRHTPPDIVGAFAPQRCHHQLARVLMYHETGSAGGLRLARRWVLIDDLLGAPVRRAGALPVPRRQCHVSLRAAGLGPS